MAAYAVFLATGHTIRSQSIKSGTILLHLLAGLIQKFDAINRDVRKEDNSNNLSPPIKVVMNSIEKFEKVPNRREAYTITMQKNIGKQTLYLKRYQQISHMTSLNVAYKEASDNLNGANQVVLDY